jgi:hypothetical protein
VPVQVSGGGSRWKPWQSCGLVGGRLRDRNANLVVARDGDEVQHAVAWYAASPIGRQSARHPARRGVWCASRCRSLRGAALTDPPDRSSFVGQWPAKAR